ncbi:MAG: DMT family transporter [Syntrophobacteraceae bacterium]
MPPAATFFALITIAMWSFLAYLAAGLGKMPPFLLAGVAMTIGGLIGAVKLRAWKVPLKTLLVGVGGIFGYSLLYFSALQKAPPVETSLVNYLWPLLIVLLSPVFLREFRFRPHHLIGSFLGLIGAGLVVTGGHVHLDVANLPGYLLAAAGALVWACYSLFLKKVPPFPNAAVGAFCLISGILSLAIHFAFEPAFTPSGKDWIFLVLLGIGPAGGSYFTWAAAMRLGDPRIIGSLSYLTPLTSTLVLVALGGYPFSAVTGFAMVLIVSGAVIGSLDLLRPRAVRETRIDGINSV